MARVNEKLVYPQPNTTLFIRRNPEKTSEWQVIDGKWVLEGGKRVGFEVSEVVETGIALGKLARELATTHHNLRVEKARVAKEEAELEAEMEREQAANS